MENQINRGSWRSNSVFCPCMHVMMESLLPLLGFDKWCILKCGLGLCINQERLNQRWMAYQSSASIVRYRFGTIQSVDTNS